MNYSEDTSAGNNNDGADESPSDDDKLFLESHQHHVNLAQLSDTSSGLPEASGLIRPHVNSSFSIKHCPANTLLIDEVLHLPETSDSEYMQSSQPSPQLGNSNNRSTPSNPYWDMPQLDTSDTSSLPYSAIYHGTSVVPSIGSSSSDSDSDTNSKNASNNDTSSGNSPTESTNDRMRQNICKKLRSPVSSPQS